MSAKGKRLPAKQQKGKSAECPDQSLYAEWRQQWETLQYNAYQFQGFPQKYVPMQYKLNTESQNHLRPLPIQQKFLYAARLR